MTPPTLFQFRVSHYNEKVRWALDHKGWPHVRRTLIPGLHIPTARWVSGQNQLPILVVDGEVIAGSARILEEIERRRPSPRLFPDDPAVRRRAMELQSFFDDEVAPDLRRLFWSCYLDRPADCARMATGGAGPATRAAWRTVFPLVRPLFRRNMGVDAERVARARGRLRSYFDRIAASLGSEGYLAEKRFGVADLAVASVMTAIIRPPQFSYPLPEPWPEPLVELRASVADHEGFRWVESIYARHRGTSSEILA